MPATLTMIGLLTLQVASNLKTRMMNSISWGARTNPLKEKRVNGKHVGTVYDLNRVEVEGLVTDAVTGLNVIIKETISGKLDPNTQTYSWNENFPVILVDESGVAIQRSIVVKFEVKFPKHTLVTGTVLRDAMNQAWTDFAGTITSGEPSAAAFTKIVAGNIPHNVA